MLNQDDPQPRTQAEWQEWAAEMDRKHPLRAGDELGSGDATESPRTPGPSSSPDAEAIARGLELMGAPGDATESPRTPGPSSSPDAEAIARGLELMGAPPLLGLQAIKNNLRLLSILATARGDDELARELLEMAAELDRRAREQRS